MSQVNIPCTKCCKSIMLVTSNDCMCSCQAAFYCSTRCKKADWKRHKPLCDRDEMTKKFANNLMLVGPLFKLACKVFHRPCEAYAYVLLLRLRTPKLAIKTIPASKEDTVNLFRLLSSCNYDVLAYLYAFALAVTKKRKNIWLEFPKASRPTPETLFFLSNELAIIARHAAATDPDSACLRMMLSALNIESLRDTDYKRAFMEDYDMYASDPLGDLLTMIQEEQHKNEEKEDVD